MKKLLPVLLAAVLILAVFASCSGGGKDPAGTDDIVTGNGEYKADYIPVKNYNNYKLRLITIDGDSYRHIVINYEETDNRVKAAQYNALARIRNTYGLDYSESYVADWQSCTRKLNEYTTSDTDEADLQMLIHREAFSAYLSDRLIDFGKLPYCDPTQPWYAQQINETDTILGKTFWYYTFGDTETYSSAFGVAFNKRLIEDSQNLTSPYRLIDDDEWYYEKFLDMIKTVSFDADADGKFNGENDVCGIAGAGDSVYPTIWSGCGVKTIELNKEGYPEFTAYYNENLIDIIYDLIDYRSSGWLYDTTSLGVEEQRTEEVNRFITGRSLFCVRTIGGLSKFTTMEDEYGLVPLPKFDDDQDDYVARICDIWANVVPATATRFEEISTFIEAYAVESLNNVVRAYYDETLKDRYANDEETKHYIDIVRESAVIDLGDTVWQALCRNKILDVIWSDGGNITSTLASYRSRLETEIRDAIGY